VVTGYKLSRSDPSHRVAVGFIYRHVMRFVFRLQVRDVDCDFRLFRRRVFEKVQLVCDSGVICVEMMKKLQMSECRIVEVPVHHYHRYCGTSQFFRFRHLKRVFIQLFSAWWLLMVLQGRSPAPRVAGRSIEAQRAGFIR
jgi:hypothetical protein